MGPTKKDVVEWVLARPGERTAALAVEHWYPGATSDERKRYGSTFRGWLKQARDAGITAPTTPHNDLGSRRPEPQGGQADDADTAADRVDRDGTARRYPPDTARAGMGRIEFLAWQLSELLADLERWRDKGARPTEIKVLDERVSAVRDALDAARDAAGQVVQLERTPAAIAEEIDRQRAALDLLQRAAARSRERRAL